MAGVSVEENLRRIGLSLFPERTDETIAPAVRVGELIFTSGRTSPQKGKLGSDLTLDEGRAAARDATLRALSAVRTATSNLDRVARIVRMTGYVNCGEGFSETPKVMNAASDLLRDLFGEHRGRHTRSAIGVYQLPGNAAVEVELIVEVTKK